MTTFDVAIAGAGFSGLVAARNLAAKGFSVLVVEVCPSRPRSQPSSNNAGRGRLSAQRNHAQG